MKERDRNYSKTVQALASEQDPRHLKPYSSAIRELMGLNWRHK